MKKFLVSGIGVFLVLAIVAIGHLSAQPTWWTDSTNSTAFIDGGATVNNYGPLNIGQLKNVAGKAKTYLDNKLTGVGGAGTDVSNLVANLTHNSTLDYEPANVGQVKAVGKLFYDRLLAVGYDTRANLITNGYPATWLYDYPWDPATPAAQNYAPANLGQLKMVFSFDLASFTVGSDSDSDGLLSGVEAFRGTSPTNSDTDGDGTNDGSDLLPLDPAFNTVPSLFVGDTSFPNITLSEPTGAVLIAHAP